MGFCPGRDYQVAARGPLRRRMDNETTEPKRRPLLQLKSAAPVAKPSPTWKCKPCGTSFQLTGEEEEWVRCPQCNARLGRTSDFKADPPVVEKLRVRSVAPLPSPKPPKGEVKVQVTKRKLGPAPARPIRPR